MPDTKISSVTVEVIRAALPSICDEMAVVLKRAAYNMFIYEIQDFSVAMVDADGNLLSQNRGANPAFLADLGPPIQSGIADIGKENFHPGDIILMNHAQYCGQHLNNVIVYAPVFFEEKLVGFSVARGHWMDIGGSKVALGITRTTDIFQEGLQFRNLKIYDQGKPDNTLFRIIEDNLRRPDLAFGDLRAKISACRLGEKRFLALLQKYGLDTVLEATRIIADQSEARARQMISEIPDGVYEAESFLDNDGINFDQTIPIKVKVIIQGSEMTVDFTGTSPQVQGPMNSGFGGLLTARVALKCLSSPFEPANEGCFRPLKVIVPPGTFISAVVPAPMASWSMGLSTVLDTIFKALAPAVPNKIAAGSKCDQGDYSFWGMDPVTRKYWMCGNIRGGGWGGRPIEDGESVAMNSIQGEVTTAPVEMQEQMYPILIERHGLLTDSGGAGKFRGGLGSEWRIRPFGVDNITANISCERYKLPPWGLWGGKSGTPNHALIDFGDGKEPEVVTKRFGVNLSKAGCVAWRSGGGGGWGDPLERDVNAVLTDVVRGYVSPEKALNDYGVVVDLINKRVDVRATADLRERLRRERGS